MTPIARIELLGQPAFYVNEEPVPLSGRHFALFALLILRDTRRTDRRYAASLLWPRSSAASSRHSLSQALYTLKKGSGRTAIISGDRSEIWLADTASDVVEFQQAISNADWPRAARLYQGSLLGEIELPDAYEFNSWVDAMRAYYVGLATEVFSGLQLEGSGVLAASLATRLPPEATGMPEGGGNDGRFFAPEHSVEWNARSGPELVDPGRDPVPFVGRRDEMERLEQLFNSATTTEIPFVVIDGEPGIGKTALVDRFARLRAIRGARVLMARGFPAERNLPFGLVAQWVRALRTDYLSAVDPDWLRILNHAFPGQQPVPRRILSMPSAGDSFDQYRLLEALRQTFVGVATDTSLLLVLDDAHWADAASLSFLHYLVRRSASSISVLASIRSPSPYGAEPFQHWEGLKRLSLGPLSPQDTAALVSRYAGRCHRDADVTVDELATRTGRNPLLLVSLLTTSRAGSTADVPDSVTDFFGPRLDMLSRDGLLLLSAVSLGGGVEFDLLAGIVGLSTESPRLISALTELHNAALVVTEADNTVRPRHAIVSDLAISRLTPPDRKALYGRAARILSDDGRSPPAVLAVHHDIAGDQLRAFEAAVSAAMASQELHASREQEFFLKLALSNAPNPTAETEIRIQLSALYRSMGRLQDGLDIISEASTSTAPASLQSRARAKRLAIQLVMGATTKPRVQVWQEIEELEQVLEPDLIAELFLDFAAAAHDSGERSHAVLAAKRANAIVAELSLGPQSALLVIRSALVSGLYSSVDEGIEDIERALPHARMSIEALSIWKPAHATLLVAAGRLVEAEAAFLEAIQMIERYCLYGKLFSLHNNLGVCYTDQGRYADALVQLDEATRVAEELRGTGELSTVADNLAMLHLERGEYELALRTVRGAMTSSTARAPRELFHRHALTGLCSLELGLLAQAFEAKREIELLLQQHEYWGSDVSYVETFLARMLVLEGRPETARERLESAVEIYRPRDLMCRARLELELVRLDLKVDSAGALERAEAMLAVLRGTGARPLIDRFEELADRARRHA